MVVKGSHGRHAKSEQGHAGEGEQRAFSARVKAVDVIQLWWRSSVAAYALLAAATSVRPLSSCRHCSSSPMKCMALRILPVTHTCRQC